MSRPIILSVAPCPICKTDKYLVLTQHERNYPMNRPKSVYAFCCGNCGLMHRPIPEQGYADAAWNRLLERLQANVASYTHGQLKSELERLRAKVAELEQDKARLLADLLNPSNHPPRPDIL